MFERIEKWMKKKIKERKRVSGLSKGLTVVDNLMVTGLNVRGLDQNYGKAELMLKLMRENKEISADELGAAMITLNNRYDKLRREAKYSEIYR